MLQIIYSEALHFRAALEKSEGNQMPSRLGGRFPGGTCKDVSLMMGAYFHDMGLSGFCYVCGERGDYSLENYTTHGWLVRDLLSVDARADQFSDAPAAVIVADSSTWHMGFRWGEQTESDFRDAGILLQLTCPGIFGPAEI